VDLLVIAFAIILSPFPLPIPSPTTLGKISLVSSFTGEDNWGGTHLAPTCVEMTLPAIIFLDDFCQFLQTNSWPLKTEFLEMGNFRSRDMAHCMTRREIKIDL